MPISKNRRKNGKKKEGTFKRQSKADIMRIKIAYWGKIEEYEKLSLEELKPLLEDKKIRSSYRRALIQVLERKIREQPLAKT